MGLTGSSSCSVVRLLPALQSLQRLLREVASEVARVFLDDGLVRLARVVELVQSARSVSPSL